MSAGVGRPGADRAVAVGALVLAVASTFATWSTATTRPSVWSMVAVGLTIVAAAALAVPVPALRGAALAASVVAVAALAGPGGPAVAELASGDRGARPGPALALVAAAVTTALAAVAVRWPRPAVSARPGRVAVSVAAAVVLALVAGGVGAVRIALDRVDPPAADPGRQTLARPADVLATATGGPVVRATAVVPGRVLAVLDAFALIAGPAPAGDGGDADGDGDGDGTRTTLVDARSGSVVWERPGSPTVVWPLAGAFLLEQGGQFDLLDPETATARPVPVPAGATEVRPVTGGLAALIAASTPELVVFDPDTGAVTRRLDVRPDPDCDGPKRPVVLALPDVPAIACRLGDFDELHVFGGDGPTATYSVTVRREAPVRSIGPGLLEVSLDEPFRTVVVDAATGVERFTVPAGRSVLATDRADVLVAATDDRHLERYDLVSGRLLDRVRLQGGAEYDDRLVTDGLVRLVGDRLVATDEFGLGTARSPGGERRYGVVVWDARTGARLGRATAGPVVASPAVLLGGISLVGAGVVAVEGLLAGPRGPDGRRQLDHVIVFTVPTP